MPSPNEPHDPAIVAAVKAYESPNNSNLAVEGLRESRVAGLGGLLQIIGPHITQLLALLRGIDLTKLPALLTAIAGYRAIVLPADTKEGVLARTRAAIAILLAWTDLTPGDRDEVLVTRLRDWLENRPQVVELLAATIATLLARLRVESNMALDVDQTIAVASAVRETNPEAFTASALDLSRWAQVVGLIWQIVQLLR